MSHLLPMRRDWRRWIGRQWLVPYVDVVVDARESSYEDVRARVGAALASTLPDVRVTVVGAWSELTDERRSPLDDPLLDLRSVRAAFEPDSRVSFVESLPPTSAPTPFRLTCPSGWVVSADALQRLIELAESEDHGLILLAAAGDSGLAVGRFERTAAIARATALQGDDEDLDDVVHEMFGTHWIDGTEWALIPAETTPKAISISAVQGQAQKWKREANRWQREAQRREQDVLQWEQRAAELEKEVEALANRGLTKAIRNMLSRR